MVEAFAIVNETFVTPPPAGWDAELVARLSAAAGAGSSEAAQKEIPQLLAKLDDPFTRWMPAK